VSSFIAASTRRWQYWPAQRGDQPPALEHRKRHLRAGPHHQAGGRACHANQHALKGRNLPIASVKQTDQHNDEERRPEQSDEGDGRAKGSANAPAEDDRQIDDVRSGKELAQCVSIVELFRRHPVALFHQHPPRPRQDAAETLQRNERKGDEEFGQCWRIGNR
jgi:hypothetical protein